MKSRMDLKMKLAVRIMIRNILEIVFLNLDEKTYDKRMKYYENYKDNQGEKYEWNKDDEYDENYAANDNDNYDQK